MSAGRTALRADIQGLRAFAVLSVVFSHARLGAVTGGFVGVDVFFVISGFLITQLLTREAERSGRVSVVGFYLRRARRILPAATLVLVATAVASALWLGPVRAPGAFRDIVWAALFALNIHLAQSGTDYFAQNLPPSPVQHFWSLGVEEQFYLVWPLLVVVVLALRRRRTRRAGGPPPYLRLQITIAAVSAASFAWSVRQTAEHPTAAYFSTLTRGWELGIGALGALWLAGRNRRTGGVTPPRPVVGRATDRLSLEIAAATGVAAIVYACIVYNDATTFPGWNTALPVLGTLSVLLAGGVDGRRTIADRLLSIRPLRTIGDWSYSLYLWHWPLLIITAQYLGHALNLQEKGSVILVAFGVSGLTYRYVETPFRTSRRLALPWRAIIIYPVSVGLVLSTCAAASRYETTAVKVGSGESVALGTDWHAEFHTGDAAVALVKASIQAARAGDPIPADLHPTLSHVLSSVADVGACDYQDDSTRTLCPRGDVASDKTIVVVGDSHGRHWIPAFDQIAQTYGYRIYYLVKVQCSASLVTPRIHDGSGPFTGCADFHRWVISEVAALHPDLVVMSTSPEHGTVYDADGNATTGPTAVREKVEQGYVDMLKALKAHAKRTVLLDDIPYPSLTPADCLSTRHATLKSCLFQGARPGDVQAQVDAAKKAGVESIRTQQWFCASSVCPSVIGDYIPYRDDGHMTNEYSAYLAPELAHSLGFD